MLLLSKLVKKLMFLSYFLGSTGLISSFNFFNPDISKQVKANNVENGAILLTLPKKTGHLLSFSNEASLYVCLFFSLSVDNARDV